MDNYHEYRDAYDITNSTCSTFKNTLFKLAKKNGTLGKESVTKYWDEAKEIKQCSYVCQLGCRCINRK